MIAYVKGIITVILKESIIVDVHGIGYEIICANPFHFQSFLQQEVHIYTYHYVREDMQSLYGFETKDEKQLFIQLISVSGIGPKSAISILSKININEFISAIELEDDKYLTQFPGIGKKTARQIILDLKGKLDGMFSLTESEIENDLPRDRDSIALEEGLEALKALGYTEREIRDIKPQLIKTEWNNTDEVVRRALTLLIKS